jgi:hypothetical protein
VTCRVVTTSRSRWPSQSMREGRFGGAENVVSRELQAVTERLNEPGDPR